MPPVMSVHNASRSWADHWHEILLLDWISDRLERGKAPLTLSPSVIRAGCEIRRGISPGLLSLSMPQPTRSWDIDELGLSVFAVQTFLAADICRTSDFDGHSIAWLFSKPGVTLEHVLELLRAVEHLPCWQLGNVGSSQWLTDTVSGHAQTIIAASNLARLDAHDPRFGRLLRAVDPRAASMKSVLMRLAGLSCLGIHSSKAAAVDKLLIKVARSIETDVVSEFYEICFPQYVKGTEFQKTARNRRVVNAYYGIGVPQQPTLEQVGKKFSITRERVRQLCRIRSLANTSGPPFAPITDRIIELLNAWIPVSVDDATKRLKRRKLLPKRCTVQGALRIAECLEREHAFAVQEQRKATFLVHTSTVTTASSVMKAAKRAIFGTGVARVMDVANIMHESYELELVPAAVRSALVTQPQVMWLDSARDWFTVRLPHQRRNPLRTRIYRVMAVAKSISVADLRSALRREPKMSRLPPESALLRFIRKTCGFNVEGTQVSLNREMDIASVFRGDQRIVVEVLQENGPVMLLEKLWQTVKARGVGHPSFWRLLAASPVLARVSKGLYGLVGANTVPGEIEEILAKRSKRQRTLQDHGWTPTGCIWTAYCLSESTLNSGVVSIPSAKKALLDGTFDVFDLNARPCGKLRIKGGTCWGIGPYFRDAGLESGDYLVLEFDLKAKRASIITGDEGILDQYTEPDE